MSIVGVACLTENMPKKIRELKAMLRKAGFTWRPGKGSHTVWEHSLLPEIDLTIAGKDGNDAKPYQEKAVQMALKSLKEVQGE